jgi:hypothetical protein
MQQQQAQGQPGQEQQAPVEMGRSQATKMQRGVDPVAVVMSTANQLMQMPKRERQQILNDMRARAPMMYSEVTKMIGQKGGGAESEPAAMPNPEQKPPRRAAAQ